MKWRMLATLLLVLLVFFLPADTAAHSQQMRVTIAPQALSFPEICQRLSGPGHQVECSPRLRQCAAVVCLHNRSWEEARDLLAAGLSVEFRKREDAPNTWQMVRAVRTAAREQRWQEQFVQGIHDAMQRQAARYTPYLAEPYGHVRDKHAQLRQEYKAALAESEQQQTEAARLRVSQISDEAKSLLDPQEWMAAKLLAQENAAAIVEALHNGYVTTEVNPTVLADRDLLKALIASAAGHSYSEEPNAPELAANYRAYAGFSFDPETLLFLTHVLVCEEQAHTQEGDYLRVALARGEHPVDSVFGGSADSGYKGLGQEAQQWLETERQATQTFLQSPAAQQSLQPVLPSALPSANSGLISTPSAFTSVSQVVEAWCRTSGQEAVCELFPARERLRGSKPVTQLRDAFVVKGAWTLRAQQGVLLVTNQLAFVDRLRSFPLAALLAWERAMSKEPMSSVPPQSKQMEALRHYAVSVTASQNGAWLSLSGLYRGHAVSDLGRSYPLALLAGKLSDGQWRAFETTQSRDETYLLPLSRFSSNLPHVVEAYCALRYANGRPLVEGSLHPGFEERVRRAALHLYYVPAEEQGRFSLMAELATSEKEGQEQGNDSLKVLPNTLAELCRLQRSR